MIIKMICIIILMVRFLSWQCVINPLRRTFNAYFSLGPSILSLLMAQPDERRANRTPTKKVLCVGVVRQSTGQGQGAWFIRTNNFEGRD